MTEQAENSHSFPFELFVNKEALRARTEHIWEAEALRLANILALRVIALNAHGLLAPSQETYVASVFGLPSTYAMSQYPQVHAGAGTIVYSLPDHIVAVLGKYSGKPAQRLYVPESALVVASSGIWGIRTAHIDTEIGTRFTAPADKPSELQFFVTAP